MSERSAYPPGVPCWVDTLQPDPRAALEFYGPLFGWEFGEPGPMPGGGEYFVAQLRGRDVAGVGTLPAGGTPAWPTYIRVESAQATADAATAAGGAVLAGPLDAAPAGRLAVLSDPTGVPFGVWEPHERPGAGLVNVPGAWVMSSLHTADPDAAAAFYGTLFGWRTEPLGPLRLCRLDGYAGEQGQPIASDAVAVIAPAAPDVPPHWNVNLRVDDVDATAEHAARLGGALLAPPIDTPGLRSAPIVDPQGAVFSVSALRG